MEKEIEKQAKVPEPVQVYRGQMVGAGCNEDRVPDRVVQGPAGGEGHVEDQGHDAVVQGDAPDAEVVQPEGALTEPIADPVPRRSARVSRVPKKFEDYILE